VMNIVLSSRVPSYEWSNLKHKFLILPLPGRRPHLDRDFLRATTIDQQTTLTHIRVHSIVWAQFFVVAAELRQRWSMTGAWGTPWQLRIVSEQGTDNDKARSKRSLSLTSLHSEFVSGT
jgi:hypothetical protein